MIPVQPDLDAVASLGDLRRRALYTFVVEHGPGVSRDQAASALGISRGLAAYHLDRLVDDGLLTARFERTGARGGPGAGRPSKLYARAARDIEVRLPPRDYELAARLFARSLEQPTGAGAREGVLSVARQFGRDVAHARAGTGTGEPGTAEALHEVMRELGYEPLETEAGDLELRNCPFDALTDEHRDLVCHLNAALVEGLVDGLDVDADAELVPRPDRCCVTVRCRRS